MRKQVLWNCIQELEQKEAEQNESMIVDHKREHAKPIERVPMVNKHYKKFQHWEKKHKLKKRYKKWCEIRKKKAISVKFEHS